MSKYALDFKEEGNILLKKENYAEAIAKYEDGIRILESEHAIPTFSMLQLHLVLLTNRLNAYNRNSSKSVQPLHDLLNLIKAFPHDVYAQVFGDDKICKAMYQASLFQESQGNVQEAMVMLQACVRYNPKDKAVIAALSRIKQSRAEELAKTGTYRKGNAKENCLQGTLCVVCQEDIGSSDTVCKLPCNHGFHENCFGEWMGTQAAGMVPMSERRSKISCPTCRSAAFK
jgi:tetratricopeptide (TPR) repeat protein